jgi:D-2-hydroxyacid dehydrogenase (NADP+)
VNKVLFVAFFFLVAIAGFGGSASAEEQGIKMLIHELGIRESRMASRDMPGWKRPGKISILVWRDLPPSGPGSEDWIREVTDGVKVDFIYPARGDADLDSLADSDVYVGWCYADAITAYDKLDYLHAYSAGVDRCISIPGLVESNPITTNSAKAASETIAEHAIALMLALTRNLHVHHSAQIEGRWGNGSPDDPAAVSVNGKTMLVLGLGGIGSQVARRAHDLGMHVTGTRNSSRNGPDYVDYVGLSYEMEELASKADVVVNSLPLTKSTTHIVDTSFFAAMKPGSHYISVGRGATTDTDALVGALTSGKLAGAGLDVVDPEPLPDGHPLWSLANVIITPHMAGASELSQRNTLMIARENLRRYVRGEKLLNLVDLERGY